VASMAAVAAKVAAKKKPRSRVAAE
jgi:hypothetical protein